MRPSRRRRCVDHLVETLSVSERRTCTAIGQARSSQHDRPISRHDEKPPTSAIVDLASRYGRYGYRRIHWLLGQEGWHVGLDRIKRIWRREGLKVPQKQPKRSRLWLNDGSCVRLRPIARNQVCSYDFVMDRTHDGRAFRMLTVIDEYTRESLAIHVRGKLNSQDVLHVLGKLFVRNGQPQHIRSDNGPKFTAKSVRDWLQRVVSKTLFIEPGSPWENGYNGSFNGKQRDECLNREIFYTLRGEEDRRSIQ